MNAYALLQERVIIFSLLITSVASQVESKCIKPAAIERMQGRM